MLFFFFSSSSSSIYGERKKQLREIDASAQLWIPWIAVIYTFPMSPLKALFNPLPHSMLLGSKVATLLIAIGINSLI